MKFKKICTSLIILIVVLLVSGFFLMEKKTFSENENRFLQKFPDFSIASLVDGTFIKDLESYVTDHFPFRDFFVGSKTLTSKALGMKEINGIYLGKDGYLIEPYDKPSNQDNIVKVLNDFSHSLDGVNLKILLAPTSQYVYNNKLPSYTTDGDQYDTFNSYKDKLDFPVIDSLSVLMDKKDQFNLYYKTDHHWTSYGAYFAYRAFCESNGLKALNLDDFNIQEVNNDFYGTFYSKVKDYSKSPDVIHTFTRNNQNYLVDYQTKQTTSLYEDSYLGKKDKYSYFLDNNHPLIKITNSSVKNDEQILIIKDSYANSLVPFITNHYTNVHVIDPRYYKDSIKDYVEKNKITNILFVYNLKTLDSDLGIVSVH